jgi:diamine N-acetyltransferase
VGAIDLYNYDPVNLRAAVGIMVASEYRRQGYALAMLKALEDLYVEPFHETAHKDSSHTQRLKDSKTHRPSIRQLYADIAAPNTASLALFRKAGYTQCGHFKEWLEYDSHFVDTIRMQKIL